MEGKTHHFVSSCTPVIFLSLLLSGFDEIVLHSPSSNARPTMIASIANKKSTTVSALAAASMFLLYALLQPASSFSCLPMGRSRQGFVGTALPVAFSSINNEDENHDHNQYHQHHHQHHQSSSPEMEQHQSPNRRAEFKDLEPVAESDVRRARKKHDKKVRGRFATHGDDLWSLRKVMADLSLKLVKAISNEAHEREQSIREKLRELEGQDPELVYKMELLKMKRAMGEDRDDDVAKHTKNAMEARSQLPHYNLEGLWVGK